MSELSVRQYLHNDGSGLTWGYDKSEADKFIADLEESHKKEVGQLLMEIAELKKEKEYVIDHAADVINGQERELRNHKYKRCLAMARYYDEEVRDSIEYMRHCGGGYDAYVNAYIEKMKKRLDKWRSLADKFKPNSTINRKEATNALQR